MTKYEATYSDKHITAERFDAYDKKGRQLGYIVTLSVVDVTPVSEDRRYWVTPPAGEGRYISVNVQKTRDGRRFGPCQPDKWVRSREECEAYVDRRVKNLKKSARKEHNRVLKADFAK